MDGHRPSPHHEPSPYEQSRTELTASLQPDRSSAAQPASTFSFPTLNLDGSVPDLRSTNASARSFPPAPPAALSSLGAKAKMAEMAAGMVSDGSIDAQYDMIDDASDLSNDDHETASLLSIQDEDDTEEGEMTPDGSMVDVREEREEKEALSSTGVQLRAENDLIDSYMSEDLETPRQSKVIKDFLGRVAGVGSSHPNVGLQQTSQGAHRVLFVSDPYVSDDTVSDVCLRIASLLLPEDQAIDDSVSQSVRLPPIFADVAASSVLQMRCGQMELLVDRCVGASDCSGKDSRAYTLHLKGSGKVKTVLLDTGSEQSRFDLQPLDLIVYYTHTDKRPAWFKFIHSAVAATSTLTMHIVASDVDSCDIGKNKTNLVITSEELFHKPDANVRAAMQKNWVERRNPATAQKVRNKWFNSVAEFMYNRVGIRLSPPNDLRWTTLAMVLWFLVIVVAAVIQPYLHLLDAVDPMTQLATRRDALNTIWTKTANSTDVAKACNISHLLPYPEVPWPTSGLVPHDVRFQTSSPNHIIIALPQDAASRHFPTVTSTHVQKRGVRLDFNQTQLVQGVYDITIHESDANGVIMVTMDTKNPALNVIAEPNFGMSAIYRKTYEKASMEISKAINKDVMVARKNAKSIGDKLGLELSAGAAATKNVTSELAIYIARDLQVLANTAVSVFAKAASASNESAANVKKELAVIRKDLIKLSDDVQKSLVSTAGAVKALIPRTDTLRRPLLVAKVRARRIRDRIAGRKSVAKSRSAAKDLSLRLRDLFSPDQMGGKAGSLADIARCSRAKDYQACRKGQKAKKTSRSSTTSKALQAIPTSTSSASQVSNADKSGDRKPSLVPRKEAEKKHIGGPKKRNPGPKQTEKRGGNGIKKNVKQTKKGGKKGNKWPL